MPSFPGTKLSWNNAPRGATGVGRAAQPMPGCHYYGAPASTILAPSIRSMAGRIMAPRAEDIQPMQRSRALVCSIPPTETGRPVLLGILCRITSTPRRPKCAATAAVDKAVRRTPDLHPGDPPGSPSIGKEPAHER